MDDRLRAAVDKALRAEVDRIREEQRAMLGYCSAIYHLTNRTPWSGA